MPRNTRLRTALKWTAGAVGLAAGAYATYAGATWLRYGRPAPANAEDADRGLHDGLINRAQHRAITEAIRTKTAPPQYTKLGGLIYIHGHGARSDWTWGCVALENDDIRELFETVTVGTPVTIQP